MSDNAKRDQNYVTSLLAVSSEDGISLVTLYADPTTHRLLVDASATISIGNNVTGGTEGSVLFIGAGGVLAQDNSNFYWDDTYNQLFIGSQATIAAEDSQFPLVVGGNVNDYLAIEIQNLSSGDSASTDISISADNDNSSLVGHYIDMGIWGSGLSVAALGQVKNVSINTAGTGYTVGDMLTIVSGDSNASVTVSTVSGGGAVTGISVTDNGTGYTVLNNIATTGGTGSGFKINVLTLIDNTAYAANDGYVYTSGGNLVISVDDGVAGKVIKFLVGGSASSNETARFTATKGTMTLGLAGVNRGILQFSGSTSGTTALQGAAVASGTLSLPAATDTVAVLAASQAFTNKTYNGLTLTSTTGTFTLTAAKTFAVTNSLTLSGTDSTVMTFPTTSKTIAANDGSNWTFGSQAIGDIVYASSTTAFTRLAAVAVGQVLVSAGTGTAPAYSANPSVTTLELGSGGATDTTLSRVSAGVMAIEGATVATLSAVQTFTATQTVSLLNTAPQTLTVAANAATADVTHGIQNFTNSSAGAMTITLTTTSAADGQWKEVRIYDFSAVAQGITWVNTENSTVTAPTTSNGSTTLPLSILFQYNSATSKWRCVAFA